MSKHSARQFTTARLVLSSAAAILVLLVGWIAFRAGGPAAADEPLIVQPSANLQALDASLPPVVEATTVPSPAASPSVSPSPSARSASPSPSPSASRKPKKSPQPSISPSKAAPSPAPSPAGGLEVTYSNSASWRDGFIAAVRVVNNGSTARDFTITISYPSGTDLRIRGDWNGTAGADDNRVTLRGNSLAPGASINTGFQAAKDDDDSSRPSGCTVVGGTCTVS
ncbi:cellulose-binding domain-containing protein [Actinoplanes sp. NBC_00393]|uniref:cellulose binding domain-containing protein n=1 Tax=Actinoplanes sp. NBC_00393 TaxID=2975953 RepID=UPI002E224E9A